MGTVNGGVIIIEELSRDYKLIGRHKFQQQEVHIGRSYQNDVIVTDQHVCADHLSISFNGEQWVATDLSSTNGSYIGSRKNPLNNHKISSGDVISMGKSKIRIIFPDHPVEATIVFSPFENVINFLRKPLILIATLILFTCLSGYTLHLNDPTGVDFIKFLVPAIGMTLMFSLWPFGVALVSHFRKNDTRIWHQLAVSFVIFNLLWLTDFFENILKFNTSSNLPIGILTNILPICVAYALFWLNIYIGFNMTQKRRNIVAASLTILLFGGSFVINLSKQLEFDPLPRYDNTLMPPSYLIKTPSTIDNYLNNTEQLFEQTRKQALEK